MKYYGIKTPPSKEQYIWWISDSRHSSWSQFFHNATPHRLPLAEAIKAYESIGYSCVELEVKEKL